MSLVAAVLLLMISPAAGITGLVLLFEPHECIRLIGRVSRWNRDMLGISPDKGSLGWMHTPLHRVLLGDRETLVQRMCDQPQGFRILNGFLRLNGVLLVVVSLSAALLAAIVLAG